MKAWVLEDIGRIEYKDVNVRQPSDGEVLIRVRAAGICGSDIPRIYTTGAHNMPLIPGHEFSGEVADIGPGVDTNWSGKRVGVFPLIPCRKCAPCKKGLYELCRHYDYLGSRRDGAFAEFVTVPADNLIELPDNVSYEEAAMLEPMAVAVHAMRRVTDTYLSSGSKWKICICGMGTIGLLLAMFLKDAGYEDIYVIGNKESQKDRVLQLGISADRFCNSRTTDASQWLIDKTGGVNVYFECVGSKDSLLYGLNATAPMGHIVTVGNPHGDMDIPRDLYWKILRNEITLTGTWNSSFLLPGYDISESGEGGSDIQDDWHYVLDRLASKHINPAAFITHRLSIEDLYKGFELMRDKTEDYCKVMERGDN